MVNIKTQLAKDGKRHDKPSQFHITFARRRGFNCVYALLSDVGSLKK
jgi:hypothetical protein